MGVEEVADLFIPRASQAWEHRTSAPPEL